MAAACPHTTPSRPDPTQSGNWMTRRLRQSGSESGQALIITALAMTLVLVMSAFAIDLATWYQKHHQAQVAADSAALAAANCLANGKTATSSSGINCTSATDTADAQSIGTQIATTNLPTSNDQVTVNTTSHTVTVIASSSPQVDFAGLMSLHPTVSARSVASYSTASANYSVFVGNDTCNVNNGVGGLQIQSNGGGNATVTGLYSDGAIQNNDNSGSAVYSGGISDGQTTGGYSATATPLCGNGSGSPGTGGSNNYWLTKNTTVIPGQETAYPEQYSLPQIVTGQTLTSEPTSQPTVTAGVCTFASTWFSTDGTGSHKINYSGTYCVTNASGTSIATSYSGSCNSSSADDTTGSIDVKSTLEGSSGYEFVGPCVVGDGAMGASIGTIPIPLSAQTPATPPQITPTQEPLIYGTAQTDTSACLDPTTTFVNPSEIVYTPDNVYLVNNNLVLNGAVYAPCGTVELYKNNDYSAFLEAANVTIDKNNFSSWAGTGPPSVPASDGLTG